MKKLSASFILFTRLPLWRWCSPSQEDYMSVVVYWPLVGWLTGGLTAALIWVLAYIMPPVAAIGLAFAGRLLLTGALHEDGLADFFDGFGCGNGKERILQVMKDSHIGTYGVLGLIFYTIILIGLLSSLSPVMAALIVFTADPFSKLCAAQLTNFLSYARPEGAKNKITYKRPDVAERLMQLMYGILPLIFVTYIYGDLWFVASIIFPAITYILLSGLMLRKIGGYTGDCCGATFLLCELSMIIGCVIIVNLN